MMFKAVEPSATTPLTYGRKVFEQLYELCMGEWMKEQGKPVIQMRDDGAYAEQVDSETLDWTPSCDLMEPGSADPLTGPLIPFPFTASQLAAFMLDGWGYFMQEKCGDWTEGPIESILERIRVRVRGGKVEEALRGAYDAYREAERVVGKLDPILQARTKQLETDYKKAEQAAAEREKFRLTGLSTKERKRRHKRYKALIAESCSMMKQSQAQSNNAMLVWRKAMVNQLLCPMTHDVPVSPDGPSVVAQTNPTTVSVITVEEPAPAQTAATPTTAADVEPANDKPAPMTTGDIAHCFDGLYWNETKWKSNLGKNPKWLFNCVVIPGQRGVRPTHWNPVSIGAALVQKGHATTRNVRAKFQSVNLLNPWLDTWKTYEADNFET